MPPTLRAALVVAVLAAVVALPHQSRANAPLPSTYYTHVAGDDVEICPGSHGGRGCHEGSVLLREDVETGETIVVSDDRCLDSTSGPLERECREGGDCCYLDECVPEGTYRYGFEEPYPESGISHYYTETTVESAPNCDAESPTSYSGDVPWEGEGRLLHHYDGPGLLQRINHWLGRSSIPGPGVLFAGLAALVVVAALLVAGTILQRKRRRERELYREDDAGT